MIERMFTDIAKFIKNQGELHNICITMLKIPYTGKSRLVLEAVHVFASGVLGRCIFTILFKYYFKGRFLTEKAP